MVLNQNLALASKQMLRMQEAVGGEGRKGLGPENQGPHSHCTTSPCTFIFLKALGHLDITFKVRTGGGQVISEAPKERLLQGFLSHPF